MNSFTSVTMHTSCVNYKNNKFRSFQLFSITRPQSSSSIYMSENAITDFLAAFQNWFGDLWQPNFHVELCLFDIYCVLFALFRASYYLFHFWYLSWKEQFHLLSRNLKLGLNLLFFFHVSCSLEYCFAVANCRTWCSLKPKT